MRPARALALTSGLCLLGLLFATAAQAAGATAVGWGGNFRGEVGAGTVGGGGGGCECIEAPVPVSGLSGVTQIAAGREHALALLADGTVMAWGRNENGELGDGTTAGPSCGGICRATPERVPSLSGVIAVAAGRGFSLALLSDGSVVAWGDNAFGALGDGTTDGPDCGDTCRPTPTQVQGLSGVIAIAAGEGDGMALLADGTVMAWGSDRFGQIGDGTGIRSGCECADRPTPVPGVTDAMAISVGRLSAMALLGDGTVKAWGEEADGLLGNGAVTPPPGNCGCIGPVSVSGLSGVQAIAAGTEHSLAMLTNGPIQSWGFDTLGQLGHDVSDSCECSPVPAPVVGLSDPQAIAAGAVHSLALVSNGTVKAWGFNLEGQLGIGTRQDREAPTAVPGITGASSIAAGDRNSFALIGPSQTLKIELAGAGAGAVGGPGILCPSGCEAHYPQGQVENLRAEPKPGSGFAGYSGPCSGTASVCQLKLDQDRTLTATFGPPKGTKITKAKIAAGKRSASFSFSAPGAITGFQCTLVKPHLAHRKKQKPRFSACKAPQAFKHLRPGRYTFKVRALDVLGADAHPATRHFTIRARRTARHAG